MKYYNYPQPRGTEVAVDLDSKNVNDYVGGGSGGAFIVGTHAVEVTIQGQTYTTSECDNTFKEINDAFMAGKSVIIVDENDQGAGSHYHVGYTESDPDGPLYTVYAGAGDSGSAKFQCSNENGYPRMEVIV